MVRLVIPQATHPPQPTAPAGTDRRRRYLPVLGWFLGIRLFGVATLAVWSWINGKSAYVLLSARWDSLWYVRVVQQGYGFVEATKDGRHLSDMAFFPLYPLLEKCFSVLLFTTPANAGLLVSLGGSLFAAAGIFALVETFLGTRVGFLTALLWGALPVSVVESMAYTESLFVALAAWSLWCLQREHWPAAGLLAAAAGLTSPAGVAVALAVWWAVGCDIRTNGWHRRGVVGLLLAPAGLGGYVLWVGWRTGSLFGYMGVQKAWGNGFDAGIGFARFTFGLMSGWGILAGIALCAGVALLIRCYLLGFRRHYPIALQVYTGVVLVLVLGASGYFGSKPRLLLPAFGLLIPAATRLAAAQKRTVWSVVAVLCVISAAYGAFWLNGSGPP